MGAVVRKLVARLAGTLIAITMVVPSLAQENEDENRFWRKEFLNYQSIGFRCNLSPDDEVNQRICANAAREAEFYASAASIPFVSAGTADFFSYYTSLSEAGLSHPLEMYLTVMSAGTSPTRATYIEVMFETLYLDAVEEGSVPAAPGYRPKTGTLTLWKSNALIFGDASTQEGSLHPIVIDKVREAFTLFSKHRGTYEP